MYEFVDTDEMYTKTILPAEAMSYNGVFIENEIPGYRTLYVSGRELMERPFVFTTSTTPEPTVPYPITAIFTIRSSL